MSARGADFRAQRTAGPRGNDWLKHIGKIGFPLHMLLSTYQIFVVWIDLVIFSIKAWFAVLQTIFYVFIPTRRKSLKSEVAVVVGSSRGVGREIAIKLGKCYTKVVLIDIQQPETESVSRTITASGGTASYFQCDVSKREEVDATISRIEREIGDISMLFHCCSLPSPRSVVTNPPSVKQTIDISVTSYFYLLDAILPHMKSAQRGHIVFLTSVAAISGFTQHLALSVSQFAIQGLYESLLEELRISKLNNIIRMTLVHIYPFIVSENLESDIRFRVPGFFGSIRADVAAEKIIEGVRRNEVEISIPKYSLYFSHVMKILPRRVTLMVREFLDTGIDF